MTVRSLASADCRVVDAIILLELASIISSSDDFQRAILRHVCTLLREEESTVKVFSSSINFGV